MVYFGEVCDCQIWRYFHLYQTATDWYSLYTITGLLYVNIYKYCRGWPHCRNGRVSQLHTLIRKRHSDSFEILCSMLSHVWRRYTFIMPMQRNDDINWKWNWYANCCDLMELQNNAFNMKVLCAIRLYPVCGYNLYPLTGLLHVNVYSYSWV